MIKLKQVDYKDLKAKQKENYNYHKISSKLADYGYTTIRLFNDSEGADFLLQHIDPSKEILKVQQKSRWAVDRKYKNKNIYICFRQNTKFYICPHDELLDFLLYKKKKSIKDTSSWKDKGIYHHREVTPEMLTYLKDHEIK